MRYQVSAGVTDCGFLFENLQAPMKPSAGHILPKAPPGPLQVRAVDLGCVEAMRSSNILIFKYYMY